MRVQKSLDLMQGHKEAKRSKSVSWTLQEVLEPSRNTDAEGMEIATVRSGMAGVFISPGQSWRTWQLPQLR